MSNHPNRSVYGVCRGHDGHQFDITHHGRVIGHLDIHKSGYRDWVFAAAAPSAATQNRLVGKALLMPAL
jgi:hypothetical protein